MIQPKIPAFPPGLCIVERRESGRRTRPIPVAGEEPCVKDPQENRKKRRHRIDPTTCERDYNHDEIEFMKAMDHYKRDNRRQFPTWSEVLEVLWALGYRKAAEPTQMPGLSATMPPKVEA